jgi:hypothetical protein
MTVREMQMAFDTRIQLVSAREALQEKPDSYTILQFLNRSQERYINDNFLSKGTLQENIEYIQKRSDVLRNLIKRVTNTESPTAIVPTEVDGGIEMDLPADYLYYIKSFSYATNTLAGVTDKTWTPNRVINHGELDMITNGVFNSPILRKPCIVFEEGEKAILYTDNDTEVFNLNYVYLRKPATLVLGTPGADETNTSELDSYSHLEIVELAVDMYVREYKYLMATQS